MQVILLSEVKGKGGEGDVVNVADGFANNYLIPQKMAVRATKGNLKQLELRRHNIAKREEVRLAKAEENKKTLEEVTVRVEARVGEEGVLFGSVTAAMIAEAIKQTTGLELDRRRIDLKKAIKTAGNHEVMVTLYRDIKALVNVEVGDAATFALAEEAAAEEAAEEEQLEGVAVMAAEDIEAGDEAAEEIKAEAEETQE